MNLLNWLRRPFASQAINPVMKDDHAQHFRELNDLLGALDKLNGNPDNNESKHNHISILLRHTLGEIAAHFHREKELMDCYGYPGKDAHQAEHSAIMKDIELAIHQFETRDLTRRIEMRFKDSANVRRGVESWFQRAAYPSGRTELVKN